MHVQRLSWRGLFLVGAMCSIDFLCLKFSIVRELKIKFVFSPPTAEYRPISRLCCARAIILNLEFIVTENIKFGAKPDGNFRARVKCPAGSS